MASLQDQLLKAGLVDKNKAKTVSKEKHKASKSARKGKSKSISKNQIEPNAMKLLNAERDRELNRQKQQLAEEKAIAAQIRQLIDLNKIDLSEGGVAFNFVYAGKVKTLHVTEQIQNQLVGGRLAIVKQESSGNTGFDVVPKQVAEKIAQRDIGCVVHQTDSSEQTDDENDPYADFKVPDDLMW